MENILLEAINYVSNISRQKVTVDNISTFLDKRGPNNLDNEVIIKTLQEMQAKGLINKSNRLISPKTPASNPSPAQVSTDPVNDTSIINDSINKSLNKSIPPSITRSLPPALITNVNTTPRLLSISNSTLNAKLESLESKLYGKIIAMKSYFTNELQSLNNETPGSENKDSDNNFEEKTVLENKIKLLELENKLLKDDISNKQKFIDTILEHNGKLINNQTSDVTPIIRKRIPDSQHQNDRSNDIDRDDQREHVENKSHKEKHKSMKVTKTKINHHIKNDYHQRTRRTKIPFIY